MLSCRFEQDIKLTKALGATSLRFSLEWARIEPQQGQVDEAAIARWADVTTCSETAFVVTLGIH